MNRIFELTPSPEESVIPRILLLVHQAVDENFPAAEQAGRQFIKTVFSDDAIEKTAGNHPASFEEGGLGSHSQSTAVKEPLGGGREPSGAQGHIIPPPPVARHPFSQSQSPLDFRESAMVEETLPPRVGASFDSPAKGQPFSSESEQHLNADAEDTENFEKVTPKQRGPKQEKAQMIDLESDWTTRITLALLLAGILLLGYVVFA